MLVDIELVEIGGPAFLFFESLKSRADYITLDSDRVLTVTLLVFGGYVLLEVLITLVLHSGVRFDNLW